MRSSEIIPTSLLIHDRKGSDNKWCIAIKRAEAMVDMQIVTEGSQATQEPAREAEDV